jgi:hypothetical protein
MAQRNLVRRDVVFETYHRGVLDAWDVIEMV